MRLLEALKAECAARGIPSMVYTFRQHPLCVLRGADAPDFKTVMSEEDRLKAFEEAGVDRVYLQDFTEEFAAMSPENFAKDILAGELGARLVAVGYDYRFGKGGRGTAEDLAKWGGDLGFETIILPEVRLDGVRVSSTKLREFIQEGDMEGFRRFAGRPYSLEGEVVRGRRVGMKLGFPTANILPPKTQLLPPPGVYETVTELDGLSHRSVTNIGTNPTFSESLPVTVETHIPGISGELYGRRLRLRFARRLRGEKKFSGPAELSEQLRKDVAALKI